MKKMKISARLYISFGIVMALLIIVVGFEVMSVTNIRARKDRLANADAINKSVLETRKSTLDYYVTNSDEDVNNMAKYYENTKALMEDGLVLYKDAESQQILETMKSDMDSYYTSFTLYRDFVDLNNKYSDDMVNNLEKIVSELDALNIRQQNEFTLLIGKTKRIVNEDKEEIIDFVYNMVDEYYKASRSNDAIALSQNVMNAELQYILYNKAASDSMVYSYVENLKSKCDNLYEDSDNGTDKKTIDKIRERIDEFVIVYGDYKQVLISQAEEEEKLNALATNIIDSAEQLALDQENAMNSSMNFAIINAIVIGLISIIVGSLFAIRISSNLTKQLTTNINQLSDSAKQVSSASSGLASTSQQLSEGSAEQAASIEETSATMDETSSMVKQNSDHTRRANELSKEASDAADIGSDKMKDMTKSMDELKKSSVEIGKIIKVIDDIAFQTNMLALNAAVEAARAGDAGLGFAVVAQEVRNLAQKSADAAKDTAEIIDKNIELSNTGVLISDDVNTALDEIISKTQDVNQIIGEISKASEEQAKGTNQVTIAIGEMENVVQSNAATAEESAASAEQLQTQAKNLESVVNELSKMVSGSKEQAAKSNTTKKQTKKLLKGFKTKINLPLGKKDTASSDETIPLDDNEF